MLRWPVLLLWHVCVGVNHCECVLDSGIKAVMWSTAFGVWLPTADVWSTSLLFTPVKNFPAGERTSWTTCRHKWMKIDTEAVHIHEHTWWGVVNRICSSPHADNKTHADPKQVLLYSFHRHKVKTLSTIKSWLVGKWSTFSANSRTHTRICFMCVSYRSPYGRRGGSSAGRRNHSDSRSILSEPTHHEEWTHSSYRHNKKNMTDSNRETITASVRERLI